MASFLDPKKNWLVALHMKSLSANTVLHFSDRLLKIRAITFVHAVVGTFLGLRYDDLHDPYYDLDIKEVLRGLPREIVDARNQRLKRSMGLSMKHQYLPEDLLAMQTSFRSYLQDMLALVKKEKAEREALGALPLYQRTII